MEFSFPMVLILPFGLGLLGFIEPCTVGGHLIFLQTLAARALSARMSAVLIFALVRTAMMAAFGAVIAWLGRQLIDVQTTLWLVFGSVYLLIGLAYLGDRIGYLKRRINLSPPAWRQATGPVVLGVAFGLNIPACAAPILFGLIGLAAGSNTVTLGVATMAVFGLALSLPLVPFAIFPSAAAFLERLISRRISMRLVLALVFIVLGAWSIWFGLFVDPADWASL